MLNELNSPPFLKFDANFERALLMVNNLIKTHDKNVMFSSGYHTMEWQTKNKYIEANYFICFTN